MILTIIKIRRLCFTGFLKLFVASCVDPGELIGSAPTLGFMKPTGFVLIVKLLLRKIVSSLNYCLISAYFVELFQSTWMWNIFPPFVNSAFYYMFVCFLVESVQLPNHVESPLAIRQERKRLFRNISDLHSSLITKRYLPNQ